jgi:hypothetical protein
MLGCREVRPGMVSRVNTFSGSERGRPNPLPAEMDLPAVFKPSLIRQLEALQTLRIRRRFLLHRLLPKRNDFRLPICVQSNSPSYHSGRRMTPRVLIRHLELSDQFRAPCTCCLVIPMLGHLPHSLLSVFYLIETNL